MKLRYVAVIVILMGLVLAVEYDITQRTQQNISTKHQREPQQFMAQPSASVVPVQTQTSFETRFAAETKQIAQLQADSSEVEKKMETLAITMSPADIRDLSKIAQNTSRSGDERVMAVELLSRKKTPEALQALTDFVKNHEATTQKNWSRANEFESVIRAQAIEGIASYPQKESALSSLNMLSQKVDESFLLDRILRSSESVKGHAASAELQDDAALKKLIE